MYSLVVKLAIDVIRAELLAIEILTLGLTCDNVEDAKEGLEQLKFPEMIRFFRRVENFIFH